MVRTLLLRGASTSARLPEDVSDWVIVCMFVGGWGGVGLRVSVEYVRV
jgi:hypothetical protein